MPNTTSPTRVLRMGTRTSTLALAQSLDFAASLDRAVSAQVETVGITTHGDIDSRPLADLGSVGVFVKALRAALLSGRIDFAVHSAKDLPTEQPGDLVLAAMPVRADARDVLISRDGMKFAELPAGARIGTGSPRRAGQVLSLRPDLTVVPIRGNVDTRINGIRQGKVDAVVLAAAGLERLGRTCEVTEFFHPAYIVPAPAQGALAVECRADDTSLISLLSQLDDATTRAEVIAERRLLADLEGGCSAPIGAWARVSPGSDDLLLSAVVATPDGSQRLYARKMWPAQDPAGAGAALASEFLDRGAGQMIGGQ